MREKTTEVYHSLDTHDGATGLDENCCRSEDDILLRCRLKGKH